MARSFHQELICWLASPTPFTDQERHWMRHALYKVLWWITSAFLVVNLFSAIGLVILATNPAMGPWLLNQDWFQVASHWWQNSWPGQVFEWALP